MAVYVKLELTAYLLGIDYSGYFCSPFVKQCQYCFIHIIIYKDNASLRTLNQVGYESVCVINLSIVEHALFRLCITLVQSAEHFFYTLVRLL